MSTVNICFAKITFDSIENAIVAKEKIKSELQGPSLQDSIEKYWIKNYSILGFKIPAAKLELDDNGKGGHGPVRYHKVQVSKPPIKKAYKETERLFEFEFDDNPIISKGKHYLSVKISKGKKTKGKKTKGKKPKKEKIPKVNIC